MSQKPERGERKAKERRTADGRLPGDPSRDAQLARMIRVDHAGEYGARRIYEGQLAVLSRSPSGPVIARMHEQEARHLAAFEAMIAERRVRPTALQPVWHVAGFALGAATALMGDAALEEFRADELEHRDTGLAHGAVETPGYEALSAAIKTGSRLAIWLSERV
jgi:ubiquinone biosynthesis monooxygenase Coq7